MYSDAPYSHEPYSTVAPVNAGVIPASQVVTAVEGSVTQRFTYRVTGQVATFSEGSATVKTAYNVLGQQINSVQGMTTVRFTYRVTGQAATFSQGTQSTLFGAVIYPSGNVMSGLLHSPTVQTKYFVNGMQIQSRQGNELIWSLEDNATGTIWVPVITGH